MGRSLWAEERIQEQIDDLYVKDDWVVGIVIGQISAQRDYVIHLAKTPFDTEDPASDAKPKSQGPLETLDVYWVANHARQVARMLPGGIIVLGVFTMGAPDMLKQAQAKLRQTVFAVHKILTEHDMLPLADHTDRVLLQLCSVTRKLTCKTFDVADHKCVAKPAEWKFQSFVSRWSQLRTSLCLDVTLDVPRSQLSQELIKQIQKGLSPHIQKIWSALATLNGQLLPAEQQLCPDAEKSKRKRQRDDVSVTAQPPFDVNLFAQMVAADDTPSQADLTECGAKMLFRGTVKCRAFVHSKATVQEAVQALKSDVIRTLMSRCELLCEELLQTEETHDQKILYETPIRAFVSLHDIPVSVCDYTFPDEEVSDTLDRIRELLDMEVNETDIENVENFPKDEELIKPDKMHKLDTRKDQQSVLFVGVGGLVASCVVALIAMTIYQLL